MATTNTKLTRPLVSLALAAAATAAFAVGFVYRWFPLGVPGQFVYPRLGTWDVAITPWLSLLPAVLAGLTLIGFVVWSARWIESASRRVFLLSVLGVIVAGGSFQLLLEIASPDGLRKWATLFHSFRLAARLEFTDVPYVLAHHAEVAASFEPNHVSANPAGWIVVYRSLLSFYDDHPSIAAAVWGIEPHEVAWSLRSSSGARAIPLADRAAVTTVAYLSRLAALLAAVPIAWLVRQRYCRGAAILAAAMSMLIPAAILLAPAVDSVYPTFATLIVAMSYYASSKRSWPMAAGAGALIALGMLFSLTYLVVAATCALLVAFRAAQGHRPTAAAVASAPAAWFLVLLLVAILGHRPWESWWINLEKNREFNAYSGCTYSTWVFVNLAEFGVAMGIPVTTFVLCRVAGGLIDWRHWRTADAVCLAWSTTLALLVVAGTNRGEVSRLWLFLMPLAAALAIESLDVRSFVVRAVVACALVLQAANCALVARELVILWQWLPHEAAELLNHKAAPWSAWRRLSDEELLRRNGSLPISMPANSIRPGQTVYLWSAQAPRVGAASDAESYARFLKADQEHDMATLNELTSAGRISLLEQNSNGLVVKTGERTHIVRLLDGSGSTPYVGVDDVHAQRKP